MSINRFKEEIKNGERFEFGKNWKKFLSTVTDQEINKAGDDIKKWLDTSDLSGKKVIDIGCGSGIHSLSFYLMGAAEVISFDYDSDSVSATEKMWRSNGKPSNWKVMRGSVLDDEFIKSLGKFDVVYSWGVLHHTGNMWKGIDNAISLMNKKAILWIAIYKRGPHYQKHLDLKKRYNKSSPFGKKTMTYKWILNLMMHRLLKGRNPFNWNKKIGRGMNVYNDIIDWLGGLPYEVAGKDEIIDFCTSKELQIDKTEEAVHEGGCSNYLFRKI